jgi:hypothetical protein
MKTEQDLATLILNRWHELGSAGVAKNDRFNDRYLQQYEAELDAIAARWLPSAPASIGGSCEPQGNSPINPPRGLRLMACR